MQISEIKKNKIRNVVEDIMKVNPDVLYLADSLGSMNKKNILNI